MRTLLFTSLFALAGCATTGTNLALRPANATYSTGAAPQTVANCIVNGTPGLYSPVQTVEGAKITVGWRQEPSGQVASFTITPDGAGSRVEVRKIGLVDRHVAKVAGCWG